MELDFEYLKVVSALDSFHAADIGNIIIQANNDQELSWYIYINTDLGWTTIKEFGPLHPTIDITKNGFNFSIERREYNEKNIAKKINDFLNNPRRAITQVQELDKEEFSEYLEKAKNIM